MRIPSYHAVFVMACALSACSSALQHFDPTLGRMDPAPPISASATPSFNPDTYPYWSDPRWQVALLNAVQSVVHAPTDTPDLSAPSLHGRVQFTLVDGEIEYPEITESTGQPELDRLMLQQVASASAPKPDGPHAGESHDFALYLEMPTPFETFEYSVYAAMEYWKLYPKDAIITGSEGVTTVSFDYLDGKASSVTVTKTSHDKLLDETSYQTVYKTILPSPPAAYAGKTLHMDVLICYSINDNYPCQKFRHAIHVRATRFRR